MCCVSLKLYLTVLPTVAYCIKIKMLLLCQQTKIKKIVWDDYFDET